MIGSLVYWDDLTTDWGNWEKWEAQNGGCWLNFCDLTHMLQLVGWNYESELVRANLDIFEKKNGDLEVDFEPTSGDVLPGRPG